MDRCSRTEQLPLELKRFVREKAGGNPFYLEEIINSLVESENLFTEKDRWVLRKTIEDLKIFSTVHGVIAARIDRLEAEMKGILQEAAVIGRSFSHDILSHISDFKNNIWHHLSSLETLDIIKARSFRPSVEYVFKHALTQEVVYSGLIKSKRKEIHERIGHVIEHLYTDRISEYYETLAYHFQKGSSHKKAVEYLAKSGEKSLARYALEEAHQYYQNAYDSIGAYIDKPESENLKINLLNKWAFVYYYRGRYKELLNLIDDHKKTAESLPENEDRAMFHAWLGCAQWHREQFKEAHQNLLTALSLAEEIKNLAVVGYACCWLTWVCTELGIFEDAITYAGKAQDIYQSARRDDYIYFSSMAGMGYAYWHKGEKAKTIEVANTLLKFGREHGDYRSKGMGYCCLGWSELIEGNVAEATRLFEKAVQISVDPWYSIFPKLALAYGLVLNGKVHEARRNINEIEKFCDEFGVEFAGKPARFFQGVVLVGEGRTNEGLHILEESCEQWMQNGSKLRFAACGSMLAAVYSDLIRKARAGRQKELASARRRQSSRLFSAIHRMGPADGGQGHPGPGIPLLGQLLQG